jgi:hypothetical protein
LPDLADFPHGYDRALVDIERDGGAQDGDAAGIERGAAGDGSVPTSSALVQVLQKVAVSTSPGGR